MKEQYRQIKENNSLLTFIQKFLQDLRKYIKEKSYKVPQKVYLKMIRDIMGIYFNWMSIVSGILYYVSAHDFGNSKQKTDIITALEKILGN